MESTEEGLRKALELIPTLKEEFWQRVKVPGRHDLAEAAYLGDRIVLMNEGRIVQIGTLQDLRAKPASDFVIEFINAQRDLTLV